LNSGDPHYPVPWARTPATSFLLTAAATREAIEPAGFRALTWQDDSEAANAWFAQLRASGPPPSPNLGVVMGPDFAQLSANLGRNLMEGRLRYSHCGVRGRVHEDLRAGPMRANDLNRAWIVVVLLFLFMVINFADKAVIGIAAVPIMQELELGPRQFGLVGSSFFMLFAVSSVATGFLVNRAQTRWVLLAMGFIWALTQFPMIGSVGFETLVACRIMLGTGEGPATLVALHPAYKWFPNKLRTLPTAVIVQGGAIGVLVALPLLNWVIVRWAWHWAFGSLGLAGC
jgi:hypothetical protein